MAAVRDGDMSRPNRLPRQVETSLEKRSGFVYLNTLLDKRVPGGEGRRLRKVDAGNLKCDHPFVTAARRVGGEHAKLVTGHLAVQRHRRPERWCRHRAGEGRLIVL